MAERILRVKLEATFGLLDEVAKKQIDIIKDKNGAYHSKCTSMDAKNKRISSKKRQVSSDIEKTIKLLSTIQIPAFPKHQMDCDGEFTELEIGGYAGKSSFRWWSVPPEGWEVLDEIVKKINDYAGIYDDDEPPLSSL
ncbi:MAG: hypothetical protein NMNS01_25300 [Nitrosomonas sp.]|nr:MAG: hypothetical protein NMNS01_25300 [Nitrosomonas sp.]